MNIKLWKQFSDKVDKRNNEYIKFYLGDATKIPKGVLIEKSIENFYEYQAGKLKL